MEVEVVTGALRCQLGEGPHWCSQDNVLYYVDIPQGRVLRYDPKTSTTSYVNVSEVQFSLDLFVYAEFMRWESHCDSINFLLSSALLYAFEGSEERQKDCDTYNACVDKAKGLR